jgi:hypothetical protein
MTASRRLIAAVATLAILSGCGGGSASSPLPAPAAPAPSPVSSNAALSGSAAFTIVIPPRTVAGATRRPAYITSNVQGIDFTVTKSTGQIIGYVFYALTPQATYCATTPAGLTCTLQVNAPPGNDTFIITTYDATAFLQAQAVSSATITQTISATTTNAITAVTNPIPNPSGIVMVSPAAAGTIHVPLGSSVAMSATFTDVDGLAFTGSFDGPLNLSLTGSSHYSLSQTSWSGTGTTVQLVNDGTAGSAALTLTFNGTTYAQQFDGCIAACYTVSFTAISP